MEEQAITNQNQIVNATSDLTSNLGGMPPPSLDEAKDNKSLSVKELKKIFSKVGFF
jgi:hypothetical protein